jgi:hypothetical protein|mmetsp:Transcript_6216/g.9596  ORF Transcript_6216/g.9596 Transcript_6216/m.9596 type:complete len:224 (+) Transcript_6216:482-1153(+)
MERAFCAVLENHAPSDQCEPADVRGRSVDVACGCAGTGVPGYPSTFPPLDGTNPDPNWELHNSRANPRGSFKMPQSTKENWLPKSRNMQDTAHSSLVRGIVRTHAKHHPEISGKPTGGRTEVSGPYTAHVQRRLPVLEVKPALWLPVPHNTTRTCTSAVIKRRSASAQGTICVRSLQWRARTTRTGSEPEASDDRSRPNLLPTKSKTGQSSEVRGPSEILRSP